jgi:predicted DNA binding CopG/RHH family protein
MKKMSRKIPKFKTEDEEREFWATHDSMDFIEQAEEVEPIEFIRKPVQTGVLRLDIKLLEELRKVAAQKNIPANVLASRWLADRLANEL